VSARRAEHGAARKGGSCRSTGCLVGAVVTDTLLGRTGTLLAVEGDRVMIQWHDKGQFVTTVRLEAGRYTITT
jgi:hypothetical protein